VGTVAAVYFLVVLMQPSWSWKRLQHSCWHCPHTASATAWEELLAVVNLQPLVVRLPWGVLCSMGSVFPGICISATLPPPVRAGCILCVLSRRTSAGAGADRSTGPGSCGWGHVLDTIPFTVVTLAAEIISLNMVVLIYRACSLRATVLVALGCSSASSLTTYRPVRVCAGDMCPLGFLYAFPGLPDHIPWR